MFKLEDVALGIWIADMKKEGLQVRYEKDERVHNDGCRMVMLLPVTKVLGRCFVFGRNSKKEMLLDAVVTDKYSYIHHQA